MQKPFTPNFTPEQIAAQLLFLFEIMPDEVIQNEGFSPSATMISRIKSSLSLPDNKLIN